MEYIKLEQPYKPEVIDPIIEQIKNEPESYNQNKWGEINPISETGCGTACCIAGWAVSNDLLSKGIDWTKTGISSISAALSKLPFVPVGVDVSSLAEEILGLNALQGNILFDGDPEIAWPEPWNVRWESFYRDVDSDESPAEIAIDLLEHIRDYGPDQILGS